jgi:hypothetical protein
VGIARQGAENIPTEQPLLTTDPSRRPRALEVVRQVGGIRGFNSVLAGGRHRLTDAELALGKDVAYMFTVDADAIKRAARFYWGRDARRPGSIYVMFELLGCISVQTRERARQANVVVVRTALLLRKMLAKGEIDRDGIDRLLNAIRELGMKSKAFMAVVDSLPPVDRSSTSPAIGAFTGSTQKSSPWRLARSPSMVGLSSMHASATAVTRSSWLPVLSAPCSSWPEARWRRS